MGGDGELPVAHRLWKPEPACMSPHGFHELDEMLQNRAWVLKICGA